MGEPGGSVEANKWPVVVVALLLSFQYSTDANIHSRLFSQYPVSQPAPYHRPLMCKLKKYTHL